MEQFDYKKTYKQLYFPATGEFSLVDVPGMNFLMIDGHGDPNRNPDYQMICESLYSVAYTLKFGLKAQGYVYSVPPLEGLWWMEDMAQFSLERKADWDWTMMIMQPEWVTEPLVEQARQTVARKKDLPQLGRLRFETYFEGISVQTLYFGAYADEGTTIARLHTFIDENGYLRRGKHHEIYLGDPRKSAPDKLKTVIRQPIKKL